MKKLTLYIFLVLIVCSAGFASQDCKEVSYITEDGYKRYKTVCGATLMCDSSTKRYGISYTFDFKNQYMTESIEGRDDWGTYIVGSINSEIFTYGIYEDKNSKEIFDNYIFYVMTSNLDNHFDIISNIGDSFDFRKILRTLKSIDRNVSSFDKYITVPSKRGRNDEKEKEKFDAILEFMSTLKKENIVNLKCHGI